MRLGSDGGIGWRSYYQSTTSHRQDICATLLSGPPSSTEGEDMSREFDDTGVYHQQSDQACYTGQLPKKGNNCEPLARCLWH
jgi:hypothetical protein